jgi:PKD repeat protein
VQFYGTPTTGNAPLNVQFYDQCSSYPPTISWNWSFGDGAVDTTPNPVHTYTTPGTYTVQLIVSNSYGTATLGKGNYLLVNNPAFQVTHMEAMPSYGGIKLYWQNPNRSDYSGTLIVYRTDRYPLTPEDGTILYWYNGTQCNFAGTNGQKYYFGIFVHDTAMNFYPGVYAAGIPNSYSNVRDFSLYEPWVEAVGFHWINPVETGKHDSEILIRRKDRLPVDPADGYDPDSGRWFQYWYNTQFYGEPGLTVGSTYYYGIYAVDTMMNFAGGLAGAFIPGNTGISNVSSLRFTPGYGTISVNWINPDGAAYVSTLVVRRTDRYPAGPTDGTAVYWYSGSGFLDSGLSDGQKYYYGIFAMDTSGQFSPGIYGGEYCDNYDNVKNVSAIAGNGSISLQWQNPNRTDYLSTLIIRRTDRIPMNATDGISIYWNNGTSCTDTNVINGQTYYYGFFAHDSYLNFSEGLGISSIPGLSVTTH